MIKEKYQIIDHGVGSSDYFQGCGVSFTPYKDCFTGIGDTAYEALEDALEQAAQCQYVTEDIPNTLSNISEIPEEEIGSNGYSSLHHFVSIRIGRKG